MSEQLHEQIQLLNI